MNFHTEQESKTAAADAIEFYSHCLNLGVYLSTERERERERSDVCLVDIHTWSNTYRTKRLYRPVACIKIMMTSTLKMTFHQDNVLFLHKARVTKRSKVLQYEPTTNTKKENATDGQSTQTTPPIRYNLHPTFFLSLSLSLSLCVSVCVCVCVCVCLCVCLSVCLPYPLSLSLEK